MAKTVKKMRSTIINLLLPILSEIYPKISAPGIIPARDAELNKPYSKLVKANCFEI